MPEPFTWNGDAFLEKVKSRFRPRVATAAQHLKAEMKVMIGIQGPPPSQPGEPLHMDTTRLNQSIEANGPADEGDRIFASVGSPIWYGTLWEKGDETHPARPWCLRTLLEQKPNIRRDLIGK